MKNDCQTRSQLLLFILTCITFIALPCSSRSGRYRIVSESLSINDEVPHSHKRSRAHDRISGGYTAKEDEFPSYIGLKAIDKLGNTKALCGGVAISNRLILTAAHCFAGESYDIIAAPSIHFPELWESKGVRTYKVDKSCSSLRYNDNSPAPAHDYQILRLEDPIPQIKFAIFASEMFYEWGRAVAVGNGLTNNAGLFPTYAESLQALPVRRVDCRKMRDPTRMCFMAYDKEHIGDTCQGDSGSPIYGKTLEGRDVVIALTSFGPKECEKGKAGISINADVHGGLEEILGLVENCTTT